MTPFAKVVVTWTLPEDAREEVVKQPKIIPEEAPPAEAVTPTQKEPR